MRLVGPAKKKSTLFPLLCVLLLLLSFARRVEQWEAEQWKREKPEASVDSHLDKCICCSCRRQPTLEWQWQHHLFALMQSTIIKNLHSWVYYRRSSLIVESLAIAVVTHHHQDLQQPLHTCYSCYLLPSSFLLNQGDLKLSDQTADLTMTIKSRIRFEVAISIKFYGESRNLQLACFINLVRPQN